jgi:hypothetical protein
MQVAMERHSFFDTYEESTESCDTAGSLSGHVYHLGRTVYLHGFSLRRE